MTEWRKFFSLSFREQCLIGLALVTFPLTRFGLRWLGLGRLVTFLRCISPATSRIDEAGKRDKVKLISRAVTRVGRVYGMSCLESSIVLWWLLRWHKINGVLYLGAPRQIVSPFVAHAWVECCGAVVNDASDMHERYTVLTTYNNG